MSILDDLSPFSIWEGMAIYRERVLVVLTSGWRSMTFNKHCSLSPPSQHLLKRGSGRPQVNQSVNQVQLAVLHLLG